MPTEFKLPELGENITAGDVVRILVAPGDTIAKDQAVVELETDKATIEVPSSVAGTVEAIAVKPGDRINVGQVVLTVADGAPKSDASDVAPGAKTEKADSSAVAPGANAEKTEPSAVAPDAKAEGAEKSQKPAPARSPEPDTEGAEGGLDQRTGQRQRGDGAERGVAERGTGRADQPETQQAEAAPPKQKRGEVVDISRGARGPQAAPSAVASEPPPAAGTAAPAAPSVRRLARELGVDISLVAGSGTGGRISLDDVQSYVKHALSGSGPGAPALAPGAPLPDFSKWGEVERKPMSSIRRKTADHLSHAWNAIPHVTQHDEADITELEKLRKQYSPQAEQAGGKMTITAIALKVIGAALERFPQFNASADMSRHEIIYRHAVHVGVAVDTDRGLLVPVVRDVDRKGILDLAVELSKLSEKARGGKLSLEEMQGGGFTITNLGGIGGTSFTPIVNWPEVAILGISRGTHEPVYDGQQFQPRLMLPLSLSYDHRVIDGADAARFLRWVAEAFQQPFVLSL
jgi:pyruvate dehydrogenase E2 component (dihydrolipoamide acetyltransferase)